jgi:hypothetical protein
MAKFLSGSELYETIQLYSSQTKENLWVSSPKLGTDAHKIFSQEILKKPPTDIRFVFPANNSASEHQDINPYELQYLKEHFKENSVKTCDELHSNLFIFDNIALITSANLTTADFTSNIEVGVTIDGSEVDKLKTFFDQNLWQKAKLITDLRNQKKRWNLNLEKLLKKTKHLSKKIKTHTLINDWTDESTNAWYIGVINRFPAKTIHRIKKETNWGNDLLIVGDIGYGAFKELRLGDLTYISDLNKHRGGVLIQMARTYDKSKVETDDGDFHLACHIIKNYVVERKEFYDLLKKIKVPSRNVDIKLNAEQISLLSETLSTIKLKRKKSKRKMPTKIRASSSS